MNIFTKAGKAIQSAVFGPVTRASVPTGTLEFMNRWGKMPDVSQQALVARYWGWVYACAQVSASRVASTPFKLYASRKRNETKVKNFECRPVSKQQSAYLKRRMGKALRNVAGSEDFEELDEHPLLDLLAKVSDNENGYETMELTQILMDLTGDAYWYLPKGKMGVPDQMFVLRSQWTKIVPDEKNFIKEYRYGVSQYGANTVTLDPKEVIHFKYPNPNDPWYGMGPVQAASFAIESQELREKFIIATMSNMARPDLIVKYLEGELEPKERQLVEREWNQTFRGAKNAGKVKVTDYRYEIDKVGWNPSELKFNEGEDWILKKICGAFPVPTGLIDTSQVSRAPGSGISGTDLFMAQYNTMPRCKRIEQKLNERLCPMFDERLFFAFDNPIPEDRVRLGAEDTRKLATYLTTVNEVRKRDGEDPVEWGDVPLVQSGIVPLGSQPPAPAAGPGSNTQPQAGAPSSAPGSAPGGTSSVTVISSPESDRSQAGPGKNKTTNKATGLDDGAPGEDSVDEKGGSGSGSWNGPGDPRFPKGVSEPPKGTNLPASIVEGIRDGELSNGYDVVELIDQHRESFGLEHNDPTLRAVWSWYKENSGKLGLEQEKGIKSVGDGMSVNSDISGGYTMEIDGASVDPSLAGVPIKLVPKTRNEYGRFDTRRGRVWSRREEAPAVLVKYLNSPIQKFVKKMDGEYCILDRTGKSFGHFPTKAEANARLSEKGGEGSGNFGHSGRPGELGGSGEGGNKSDDKVDPNGKDTHDQYRNPDGSWTKERQVLHDEIKASFFKGKTPVENPVSYVMGGGPASGKSTLLKDGSVKLPDNLVVSDSDAIKAMLPEYKQMVADKDVGAATFVHEESSYLSKELIKEAAKRGYNTLLDGTGDGGMKSMEAKILSLRAGGQKVVGIYVTVPTSVAVERSMARAEKTGRFVPEVFIKEVHSAVSRVLPELVRKGLLDEMTIYDTSGAKSVKIASSKGSQLTVHDEPAWSRFLAKGDEK